MPRKSYKDGQPRANISLYDDDVELLNKLQETLQKKLMMKLTMRQIVKRALLREAQAENINI